MRRIVITTLLGAVAGIICALGGMSLGVRMTPAVFLWILLNRSVMGFVIGISSLRLHWALHGTLLGLIVGSLFPYSLALLDAGPRMVAITLFASLVFGFAIEVVATVVCKCPRRVISTVPADRKAAAVSA